MLEKVAMVSHGGRCRGVALKANAARDALRFGLSNITTGVHTVNVSVQRCLEKALEALVQAARQR